MSQILDPLPQDQKASLLCCYVNATSQIQIARITNIENWYFERVVFPGQRLVFEALPQAQLEIHSGMMASSILSDIIPCERLSVNNSLEEEADSALPRSGQDSRPSSSDNFRSPLETAASTKEKVILA
ncbi:DUF1830 domain-containing protein [Synechocystis sp. LKSZ1]|uniref:DUF1830 domain-containing protein n=1 Tax=Synechocystis sp. LKSZ1 TaxID=3144951 RepID=UPI00336BFBAA